MRFIQFCTLLFWILSSSVFGQSNQSVSKPFSESDVSGMYQFLSSNWMAGREAGTKNELLAADYIASMMTSFALKPCVEFCITKNYFQDFDIIRYKTLKTDFAVIQQYTNGTETINFTPKLDFTVSSVNNSVKTEAAIVFAGYGLSFPEKGYDDYKGLDVKGKIVIVLNGFPGYEDSTSLAGKKFSNLFRESYELKKLKIKTALQNEALAIVFITAQKEFEVLPTKATNSALFSNSENTDEPEYDDADFILPFELSIKSIPYFTLSTFAVNQLFDSPEFDIKSIEKKISQTCNPASFPIKNKKIRFSVSVKKDVVKVRNVLGMIRGNDTTKNIIIGAHYDHLGTRKGLIYNGADDNASGVAGMLALANRWSKSDKKPAYNLIFAAWTAEEKGLLGSSYFTQSPKISDKNVLLYINLDMISRSELEDKSQRNLSIGTRTTDKNLRELSSANNGLLQNPFQLDLWDVTGHSGSDYGSFIIKNIPVMTFNSGLHNDYHTPRDVFSSADLKKMIDVITLVNFGLDKMMRN